MLAEVGVQKDSADQKHQLITRHSHLVREVGALYDHFEPDWRMHSLTVPP